MMSANTSQSLTPELSETWQADELFVKMKDGETERQYKQKNMAYLWNVMDRKTRFLLASKVSKHRDVGGAARAFMEARRNAGESHPERIFTDGLDKYKRGNRLRVSGAPEARACRKDGSRQAPRQQQPRRAIERDAPGSASRFRGDGRIQRASLQKASAFTITS